MREQSRAEAADDPAAAELNEGVGTADGAVDDGLVEDFGGTAVSSGVDALRPVRGRWDQGFGFTGDLAAVPVGDRNEAGMAEAAESGDAVGEAIGDSGSGHEVLDGVDGADRAFSFEGGERVHLLPEMYGIAQLAFGDAAQPPVPFFQHESATFLLHAFAIAFENGGADVVAFDREMSGFGGEVSAYGQADQIDGVGHGPSFVEIVDAPDQAAFDVTPGAEVFHVEIAYG